MNRRCNTRPDSDVVTVDYATTDIVATAGKDYQAVSETLTFSPGEMVKTIPVFILGDDLAEHTERFRINLSNNARAPFQSDFQVQVTISDGDPNPVLRTSTNPGTEGSGPRPPSQYTPTGRRSTRTLPSW